MCHPGRRLSRAILIAFGIAVLGAIVMLLWNWLLPGLFPGAGRVDYLHALGLLLLCKILFGGFRGGCGSHRFHRRFDHLSPQERDRFRQGLKSAFGRDAR
jgi:hypothetical protein